MITNGELRELEEQWRQEADDLMERAENDPPYDGALKKGRASGFRRAALELHRLIVANEANERKDGE